MKKLLYLMWLLISVHDISAQNDSSSLKTKIVSFSPQHLFVRGIRIDFDRRLSQKHWLQLSPQVYMVEKNTGDSYSSDRYTSLYGAGLGIFDRYYPNAVNSPSGLYISYGLSYNYFVITYDQLSPDSFTKETTRINKVGGEVLLGLQQVYFSKLVIDIYTGFGVRYSMREFSGTKQIGFNSMTFDYGYSGVALLTGLRIGLIF